MIDYCTLIGVNADKGNAQELVIKHEQEIKEKINVK